MIDALVKSRNFPFSVIPAKAGIQGNQSVLDSRLRGNGALGDFLRVCQILILTTKGRYIIATLYLIVLQNGSLCLSL